MKTDHRNRERTALAVIVALFVLLSGVMLFASTNGIDAAETEGDWTYDINEDGDAVTTAYTGTLAVVTVPGTLGGHDVVEIGYRTFYMNHTITSVTIPSSVKTIGEDAFRGCIKLVTANFSEGLTKLGSTSFRECYALTGVVLPESLIYIESGAFMKCRAITSIVIPDSVVSIQFYAFEGCTALTSLTIGTGLVGIANAAFASCPLGTVYLPPNVKSLANGVFKNCSLTSAAIHYATTVGDANFDENPDLPEVVVYARLTMYGVTHDVPYGVAADTSMADGMAWFTDPLFLDPYDWSLPVLSDMTLYTDGSDAPDDGGEDVDPGTPAEGKNILDKIVSFFAGIWHGIVDFFVGLWNKFVDLITGWWPW